MIRMPFNRSDISQNMLSWVGLALVAAFPTLLVGADLKPGALDSNGSFFRNHCIDCHGPEKQSAKFRLDTLSADLRDPHTFEAWVKVYDKVASGEMPPKKRPRPAAREVESLTTVLHQQLQSACMSRQQEVGRVPVRRLNNTEYENTVRELLSVNTGLRDLLPEDNSSDGFDNVGAVLDIAGAHLLAYEQTADRAVRSAIPTAARPHFSDQRTGRQITDHEKPFVNRLGISCRLDGDALILYFKTERLIFCQTARVPETGRYRVQIMASAVGTGDKPLAVGLFTTEQIGPDEAALFDVHDFQPGKPQVFALDVDLKQGQAVDLNMFRTGSAARRKEGPPIEAYKGPGLRVEWMKIEGPIGQWPPPGYEKLFAGVPLKEVGKQLVPASESPKKDAERLIRDFLPRAFRRPVDKPTADFYVQHVLEKLDKGYSFGDAMIFGYRTILSSPHFFLLLNDGDSQSPVNRAKLDDFALASRLSYFLWSSPPDDELLSLAGKSELSRSEVLRTQVERMLKSPKSQRFTENFAGQWLDLRKMNATTPDLRLFDEYDGHLLWSMPRETELFFNEVLNKDLSVLEFVDSNWTMANERMARHYGIPGPIGNEFEKVSLPPGSHRGGLMTQASILKVTADGTRSSPVLRGKWILDRIMGKPPANPPPDVPLIEPDIRGTTTIRQQLDKHRSIPACGACHAQIDPPGFALETYDPVGNWRTYYRIAKGRAVPGKRYSQGPDVEKGGQLADGRSFGDIDEFKKIVLSDKDQIARNLVRKLIVYSTGASIEYADREVVEQIVADVRSKNYGFRTLLHDVVQSRVFRNK